MYLSVCICNLRVFSNREGCTKPISTNPESMERGEYGLTRGTCFFACRLDVVAVAGLLWISWCVLGGAGYISSFLFYYVVARDSRACEVNCLSSSPPECTLVCMRRDFSCAQIDWRKAR